MDAGEALTDRLNALLAAAKRAEDSGKTADALGLLEGSPPALAAFATFHYARGSLLFRLGRVAEAVDAFEKTVALEPEVAEFASNLGAALTSRFQNDKAAADLTRAVEVLEGAAALGPKLASTHNNLGHAYLLSGRYQEALEAFDRALAVDGKDVPTLFNRAATLHALGREEDCLKTLDHVLTVDPACVPAQQSRLSTLKRLGRA